jgi:hypothetical protein
MRLGLTIGARVLVCMNMAFHGDFQPLLAKHSKSYSLVDAISIGVDRPYTGGRHGHLPQADFRPAIGNCWPVRWKSQLPDGA